MNAEEKTNLLNLASVLISIIEFSNYFLSSNDDIRRKNNFENSLKKIAEMACFKEISGVDFLKGNATKLDKILRELKPIIELLKKYRISGDEDCLQEILEDSSRYKKAIFKILYYLYP